MGTGSFCHGPQEVMTKDFRAAIWIDSKRMRDQDLAIARDMRNTGASLMLIGQNLPHDSGDLVVDLPPSPPDWQFLTDIIPAQLALDRLAHISGVDCDSFRFASYIVEEDNSLLSRGVTSPFPARPARVRQD
jgi:fructoselysine-6-P-deglycase FrlB-like protein